MIPPGEDCAPRKVELLRTVPLLFALVTLLDASGTQLPKDYALSSIFSLTTDKTDANGQCRLRGVARGKYIVQVVKGELKARSALVEVFEGGSTTVEVSLPGAE